MAAPSEPLKTGYDESKSVAGGEVVLQAGVPAKAAPVIAKAPQLVAVGSPVTTLNVADGKVLVERYFSSINTLRAQFTQDVSGEPFTQEGVFYLKKPRQFLWQYVKPTPQKIVGTGTTIYYVDEETNQVTQLPNNSGLTKFFTEGRLDLDREGVRVTRVETSDLETVVWLTIKGGDRVLGGGEIKNIRLVFAKNPTVLKVMEATDITGAVTTIRLNDVAMNTKVNSELFKFIPPQYREK